MTPRAAAVAAVIRSALDTVERLEPDERDAIFAELAADLGSRPHDGRRAPAADVAELVEASMVQVRAARRRAGGSR